MEGQKNALGTSKTSFCETFSPFGTNLFVWYWKAGWFVFPFSERTLPFVPSKSCAAFLLVVVQCFLNLMVGVLSCTYFQKKVSAACSTFSSRRPASLSSLNSQQLLGGKSDTSGDGWLCLDRLHAVTPVDTQEQYRYLNIVSSRKVLLKILVVSARSTF